VPRLHGGRHLQCAEEQAMTDQELFDKIWPLVLAPGYYTTRKILAEIKPIIVKHGREAVLRELRRFKVRERVGTYEFEHPHNFIERFAREKYGIDLSEDAKANS